LIILVHGTVELSGARYLTPFNTLAHPVPVLVICSAFLFSSLPSMTKRIPSRYFFYSHWTTSPAPNS